MGAIAQLPHPRRTSSNESGPPCPAPTASCFSDTTDRTSPGNILRDGVRATGEIERRRAHRVMHERADETAQLGGKAIGSGE